MKKCCVLLFLAPPLLFAALVCYLRWRVYRDA